MSSSVFQFLKHIFHVEFFLFLSNFLPWKIVTWKTTVPLPLSHTAWKGWIPGSLAETPWGNSSFKTSIKICLFRIHFSKEMRPEKLLFQARFNNWPTNSERFPIPLLNPPIIKTFNLHIIKTLSLNPPVIKTLSYFNVEPTHYENFSEGLGHPKKWCRQLRTAQLWIALSKWKDLCHPMTNISQDW